MTKYIYFFGAGKAEGNAQMKDLLGGKGANLAEMTNLGIPVPPGFTITTDACRYFYANNGAWPSTLEEEINQNLEKLEQLMGAKFGDPNNPLLVSVRSGAKFSMPGMMDTILNLGLNDETVKGLITKTNNERFAYDCYRRFIQMFGSVVLGVEKNEFEELIAKKKQERNVKMDIELDASALKELVEEFKRLIEEKTGSPFPQDVKEQLKLAINAVFKSWNNERAVYYRRREGIPDDLGTAVTVQTMVFGNMGNNSATGVGFTRNPATGENIFYGEYLPNAQGEDVVAGIRTPRPISELATEMPEIYNELLRITKLLEAHYKDIQDFEFTIQEGKLYMLQTRVGKRTAMAAVKIAVDMVKEGLISKEEALRRIDPETLQQLLHPILDPQAKEKAKVIARGLPASPGAASGKVVFSADDAVARGKSEPVILVRMETNPDDIQGMDVARGILTSRGGMTSHAAVVARGMGKCCVVGCEEILIDENAKQFVTKEGITVKEGDFITLDGSTGEVILGEVPVVEPSLTGEFATLLEWADEFRKLGVRANADIPRDAKVARQFGAEGIGLCRTEHMFFAEDRLPIMQEMILAETEEERRKALDKLLPMQKSDFKGLFKEMAGYPVIIRTLDPPLHEFLPKREELMVEIAELKWKLERKRIPKAEKQKLQAELAQKEKLLKRVAQLHEFNPMLGHRGCRLGITYPEITEMQARAIFEAACELALEGVKVIPEVMIPVVGIDKEFEHQKKIVVRVAEETMKKYGVTIKYMVGTMIELPRACLTADEIAREAEFFSFGTNDLTQTTFGFSRDDVAKFLGYYQEQKILEKDPFSTLDTIGVGQLIEIAVKKGKQTRPDLEVGICGEHGGDPASIEFCHKVGLNYVSCSPYRVPIARLAAARAAVGGETTAISK